MNFYSLSLVYGILLLSTAIITAQDDYETQRKEMVREQIVGRGLHHGPTLRAMREVPRHLFVPEKERNRAYFDQPLSIDQGQTISQPFIVAYMTSLLKPKPGMKVLEIGAGSGYQAAILAQIVDTVYTIEIVAELGRAAADRFGELGYHNIVSKIGDGYQGWPEHAPFDAIIVTAAPENIPPPLLAQLRDGGRMIIPVGPPRLAQELLLVRKKGDKIKKRQLLPVRFVPFTRH